jgi:1-acyl-sn-glycerol-3-phosphate acyltransferase
MILWVCGVKVQVMGLENIKNHVPYVYMTNHQSYFDIFALLAFIPSDFKFILKQELMKIPILGFSMRKAGYISIDREDPRRAVRSLNEAARRIKSGTSVVIFPEGTRSPDGVLQPFRPGGFHLALKSGCEIVPVAIAGSFRIVPKGSLKINRGRFTLSLGKPMALDPYSKKDMGLLMNRVREAMLDQMRSQPAS